jgi:hypothetical protein
MLRSIAVHTEVLKNRAVITNRNVETEAYRHTQKLHGELISLRISFMEVK